MLLPVTIGQDEAFDGTVYTMLKPGSPQAEEYKKRTTQPLTDTEYLQHQGIKEMISKDTEIYINDGLKARFGVDSNTVKIKDLVDKCGGIANYFDVVAGKSDLESKEEAQIAVIDGPSEALINEKLLDEAITQEVVETVETTPVEVVQEVLETTAEEETIQSIRSRYKEATKKNIAPARMNDKEYLLEQIALATS